MRNSRACLALDGGRSVATSTGLLKALLRGLAPSLGAVKLHPAYLSEYAILDLTDEAHSLGLFVIHDYKLNDVTHSAERYARKMAAQRADAVTCTLACGPDIVPALRREGILPYIVAYPTRRPFFYAEHQYYQALQIAQVHKSGLVVDAKETSRIAAAAERGIFVLAPGVGPQGGDFGEAVRAGAQWVVLGRAVLDAPSPGRALDEILEGVGDDEDGVRRAAEADNASA